MDGGVISKIQTGDLIKLDANKGTLDLVDIDQVMKREPYIINRKNTDTLGRDLFGNARNIIGNSEEGASFIL